jgi:hypothetical protein
MFLWRLGGTPAPKLSPPTLQHRQLARLARPFHPTQEAVICYVASASLTGRLHLAWGPSRLPWTLRRRRRQARHTTVRDHGHGARAGRQRPVPHQDRPMGTKTSDSDMQAGTWPAAGRGGLPIIASSAVSTVSWCIVSGNGPKLLSSWSGNSRSPAVDFSALSPHRRLP